MKVKKITCEEAVRCLKNHGLSTTAKVISQLMGTDSRAVATALRKATRDGRVNIRYSKGIAFYRFIRLTPRVTQQKNET